MGGAQGLCSSWQRKGIGAFALWHEIIHLMGGTWHHWPHGRSMGSFASCLPHGRSMDHLHHVYLMGEAWDHLPHGQSMENTLYKRLVNSPVPLNTLRLHTHPELWILHPPPSVLTVSKIVSGNYNIGIPSINFLSFPRPDTPFIAQELILMLNVSPAWFTWLLLNLPLLGDQFDDEVWGQTNWMAWRRLLAKGCLCGCHIKYFFPTY